MGAHYCAICRQTTFNGKGHIFGKSHQSRLRLVLHKFIEKVKEARRTLKKPQVEKYDCTQHEQKFWCYCCELEVQRHVTDCNMTVLYGGLIEHMATPEHRKKTHKFWWDNKADPKLRDKVIITEEETQRFKAEVTNALETFRDEKDDYIQQQAEFIRSQEKHRQDVLQSLLEHEPEAELTSGPNGTDVSVEDPLRFQSEGSDQRLDSSFVDSVAEAPGTASGMNLTFIGFQDSSNCGNVHTGAIPPWLQDDDPLEGSSGGTARPEIGPSLQDFLKQKERQKLKKLPPNRVGANFDHTSQTDANWLPSFGRVWNSGRRWQSRHQFRQEEDHKNRAKRKSDHSTDASKKVKKTQNYDIT